MEKDVTKLDGKLGEEQPSGGNWTQKATLTGLFDGAAKDMTAFIIPEGDERSISYAQLYGDVMKFQRDLAGQLSPSTFCLYLRRAFSHRLESALERLAVTIMLAATFEWHHRS